jgi:hypothetical protein
MKNPRRTRSLEVLARSIKDSDQFVMHVCNIAATYDKHHAPDVATSRDVRQALRSLAKHAAALSHWLQSAARTTGSSIEAQALRQMGTATRNPVSVGHSVAMRTWLAQVADVSSKVAEAPPAESREHALRAAAEGLRATFQHHGIKLSQRAPQQQQSDAVRLLCALVNRPGAAELEPAEAKQWLAAAQRGPDTAISKPKPPRKAASPVRLVPNKRTRK